MVWYSHLSKSFPQFVMIYTVKGFSIVDETEIEFFLKFPWFFCNPANVGNLISSSSSFRKPSSDIWKFLVHIMLKLSIQDFTHDLADGDCGHEIKRHLLLGRKVMTNLDSIFKSRDITLPTKIHLVKAMVTAGNSGHVWV